MADGVTLTPTAQDTDELAAARWARVADIFDDALDLTDPELRLFLDSRCGGDTALRTEVESLLRSSRVGSCFLDGAASDFSTRWLEASQADGGGGSVAPGTLIGSFSVIRQIGYGGMGDVYLAERTDPQLRQQVAIKLVREELRSTLALQRFLEERQLLASLDHPAIARLVDGGVTSEGVPWFAMERVAGVPLDRFCDERGLGVEERLALFCRVCDAVQFAHRNLVVHCDLKPTNILVTPDGDPKLLDFGVARLIGVGPADGAPEAAGRLLTPDFASPEQLRGDPVSTSSDVFSLGVVLYHLLTGTHPFRDAPSGSSPRPSTRQDPAARTQPNAPILGLTGALTPPSAAVQSSRLRRRLRGDLDAIVLKALHTQPEQRYPSAEQFARDLRRHVQGRTVSARRATPGYRTRKFVMRNRVGVSLAATAAALLVGFTALTAVQAERVATERDRARMVESFLVDLLQRADPYAGNGDALTVREMLDRGVAQLSMAGADPDVRSRLYFALGKSYHGLGEYDRAIELLDSAHVLLRRLRGEMHPQTIGAANQFADVLRFAGRYDQASALYNVILAARREQYGASSPFVARSMNGLAMVLRMQGQHEEAERLLRAALVIDRAHSDAEPAGLTQTLNNLGHVRREQGQLADAEALHRESLAARIALWGPEHFEVSVSLSNLAGVLRDRGAWAEADSLYRRVLDLRQRMVGDQHPDLASDRAGYAQLLHLRGDLDAAETLYRQALAVHRRAYPEGHPVIATTLLGLGRLLIDRGTPDGAAPLLHESLLARERVLPPEHRLVIDAREAWRKAVGAH